jgi:putative membrane protein
MDSPNPELRLHPLSWLFELFNVLKQFIVPILFLLFAGKSNSYEFWGLLGIAFMVPLAIARYYTFRYQINDDHLIIRSGLIHKTVRNMAFTRIQNVTLHQGLLHQLMQVAEVRLETGGGEKEEGRMRVLGLAQAKQLQEIIRGQETVSTSVQQIDQQSSVNEQSLLTLSNRELIKLGLISNKGMILVFAAIGGLMQLDHSMPTKIFKNVGNWLWNHSAELSQNSYLSYFLGGLTVLFTALLFVRMISIVQAILHYYGFELSQQADRLSIQRGLLSRFNGSLPRSRIQAWTLEQGFLQRRFGRFALRIDAAASGGVKSEHMESHWQLAPIADEQHIETIIHSVIPQGSWPISIWQPLHPKAWMREFKKPAYFLLIPTLILAYWAWQFALLMLLAYPWLWIQSKQWAKYAGYSYDSGLIAVREGWIKKHWRFAEIRKVQAVYIKQSPFDRKYGMATLFCDTVNAGSFEPPLAIRYITLEDAVNLHREISMVIASN